MDAFTAFMILLSLLLSFISFSIAGLFTKRSQNLYHRNRVIIDQVNAHAIYKAMLWDISTETEVRRYYLYSRLCLIVAYY